MLNVLSQKYIKNCSIEALNCCLKLKATFKQQFKASIKQFFLYIFNHAAEGQHEQF